VVDLLRARTRRFDAVFVLGLEEGSLPRRGGGSPFLDEDVRRALDARGARLERPDPVENDRYLFYTACTRASQRLYLVREAADDDGSPREASPSGTTSRRSSTLTTCAAGRIGDLSRR
jgi:superfamily I DNA/RNA helicase